ncbi:MAG: hypothetical protein U0736_01670 [Gemmataceae bacterium]
MTVSELEDRLRRSESLFADEPTPTPLEVVLRRGVAAVGVRRRRRLAAGTRPPGRGGIHSTPTSERCSTGCSASSPRRRCARRHRARSVRREVDYLLRLALPTSRVSRAHRPAVSGRGAANGRWWSG